MDYPMVQYITALIGRPVDVTLGSITAKPIFTIGGGGSTGVPVNLVSQLNTGMSKGG